MERFGTAGTHVVTHVLFPDMKAMFVSFNVITYNTVIRACEEAQRWHQVLVPSGEP